MHFKALTSMAFLGLAVIAPLVLAHPSEKDSRAVSREPAKHATPTKTPDIDLNECYRVNSPACDKAYADAEAQYLKDNPGYNPNAEPYPDSKRKTNICKCTGSLLAGGYKVTSNSIRHATLPSRKTFNLTREYVGPMQIWRRLWICTYHEPLPYPPPPPPKNFQTLNSFPSPF